MSLPTCRRARTAAGAGLALCLALAAAASCDMTHVGRSTPTAAARIEVVSSIDSWGSILTQLGGDRVSETSIIASPAVRSRGYRPSALDVRHVTAARVLVVNGIGYDGWATAAAATRPGTDQVVVDVGEVAGIGVGGNPNQCYSSDTVHRVVDAITAALERADPADTAYFDRQHAKFADIALKPYDELEQSVSAEYGGVAIGASASMAEPLAASLGLDILTPVGYLDAVSRGQAPSAADAAAVEQQLTSKQVRLFIDDVQDSTPGVAAAVKAAGKNDIPVVTLTETLSPAGATFQAWQLQQLTALRNALREK